MLIDTHCHLNMIVKKNFDVELTNDELNNARYYIDEASNADVKAIINVGTSLIESLNCIELAQKYNAVFATVGIHPNDLNNQYKDELKALDNLLQHKREHKIVGIGECGMDKHYPDYNLDRQEYGFRYQIELALKHDIALVVHTRDAAEETLRILDDYKHDIKKGIIHCFSENLDFARTVTSWDFCIGLGGTITYPKNESLRTVARAIPLEKIVLETDAPFLPPQKIRGQQNSPQQIFTIANYLAELKSASLQEVAEKTTKNATHIFGLKNND